MTIGERINLLAYEPRKRAVVSYELTAEGSRTSAAQSVADLGANAIWDLKTLRTRMVPYDKKVRTRSLRQFIESDDQALAIVDNGRGVESLSVPYPHYQLVAGFDGKISFEQFSTDLKTALDKEYRNFASNSGGFRCGCHTGGDIPQGVALLYTGYGIFEPELDEEPVGTIAVVLEGEKRKLEIPRLPDGRAAGFYNGQTGLAFSASQVISPATVKGVPTNTVFYLGKFPGEEYVGKTTPGQRLELTCEPAMIAGEADDAGHAIMDVVPGPSKASDEGWDGSCQVIVNQKPKMTVYYSFDSRPSRLLRSRPQDTPHFLIEGFVPGPFLDEFDRFWLELTETHGLDAVLANSALCYSMETLIADTGSQESYFWRKRTFANRRQAQYIIVNGKRHDVLRHTGLGYFKAPDSGQKITFKSGERSQDRQERFSLDWLDHACKVEFLPGDVLGLATALAEENAEYLLWDEGSSPSLVSTGAPLLVISADGENCQKVGSIVLESGTRLIMGGMIVQYHAS